MADPHTLYRRSAEFAQDVLGQIDPARHGDQSPCEEWTVAEAMNHLIGGQHYFAIAAQGDGLKPPPPEAPNFASADPVAAHREAARACEEAFTEDRLGETLSTVRGDIPGATLFSIAAMENVLHAWDAGVGAGLDPQVPDDLAQPILDIVAATAPNARGQGFAEEVEVADDASMTDKIVAMAGRRPARH